MANPIASGMPYWVRRRIFQRELGLVDFSGGLNLRDAPTEIANNETPDSMNVTLDERGGLQKRLGYQKWNGAAFTASSPPQAIFEWKSAGIVVTQCGAALFKNTGAASVHTFTTAARVAFAEFVGKLYAIHPVDGLFSTTDAVTWTAVASSPKGTCLSAWQNRLLAAGDPSNPTRLYASAIGDATDWATTAGHGWTNDIREKDDEPLTALKAASGVDIAGKPGILVFKARSTYRVNDPDTGSYQTLDTTVGCPNPIAVTNLLELTFVINENGIYETNGVSPLAVASGKLQPLFQASQVAYDKPGLFCAGAKGDRVHFSLPRAGDTANTLHLEYHPQQGWIMPHTDAASCYALYTQNDEQLLAGSPTVNGQVYEMGVTGADDGVAITCRYQTKWIAPGAGVECRFRRLRVFGRGAFSLYTKLDFDTGSGSLSNLALAQGAGLEWDVGEWDLGKWGSSLYEDHTDIWALGKGTHVAFQFRETSSEVSQPPALLGAGTPPDVGAFAVYQLVIQFIPISI